MKPIKLLLLIFLICDPTFDDIYMYRVKINSSYFDVKPELLPDGSNRLRYDLSNLPNGFSNIRVKSRLKNTGWSEPSNWVKIRCWDQGYKVSGKIVKKKIYKIIGG
jgi:hypothetical protein